MCTETVRLINNIRGADKGGGGGGGGEEEIIIEYVYLSVHCHHQNDSCIKMDSDESHFNVSLIVKDKVTRQCPQATTFEEKGEPKWIRPEVPLLTSPTPYRWHIGNGSLPIKISINMGVGGGGGGGLQLH